MSNVSRPNGFVPKKHLGGGVIRHSPIGYTFVANYGSNVFAGDAIALANDGTVQVATASSTNILGVFAGVFWQDVATSPIGLRWSQFWPASQGVLTGTVPEVYVYDDPNIIYEVQAFAGTSWAQTLVGNNAPLKASTAGNALTGRSGMELDLSNATASAQQFRILGLSDVVGNDASSDNYKVLVKIVETIMAPAATTNIGI